MFFICKLLQSSRIQSLKDKIKIKIKIWRRPSKQSCTIDNLSSEVLLQIFKSLDSFEIVKIRSVCKKWLEIIDENRSLWRRPILPRRENGWPASTLELFDRKSQSTLKEVSFPLSPRLAPEEEAFLVGCLERSKESLRFLTTTDVASKSLLYDLSWKLPHLVELRLPCNTGVPYSRVLLRWNEFEDSNGVGSVQNLSSLKVLWGHNFPTLFKSHLNLLSNLSFLFLSQIFKSSEWRRILEGPSQTLKFLRMSAILWNNDSLLSTLHFPRLRVLETLSFEDVSLPTWLSVPTTSILISYLGFPLFLPSVSFLCIPDLRNIYRLSSRCPLLIELEVGKTTLLSFVVTVAQMVNLLISVLKERNQQSEEGFEVDGVKMTPLKRLVIPFEQISADQLEELRGLVENLVNLESVRPLFEVEV